MSDENTKNEVREGEERRANSGPTVDRDATQPVVPQGNPNSTSPNTQTTNQPMPNQVNPATGNETPGQVPAVEKNRIEVPDVSHAAETSTEETNSNEDKPKE